MFHFANLLKFVDSYTDLFLLLDRTNIYKVRYGGIAKCSNNYVFEIDGTAFMPYGFQCAV